MKLPFNIDLSSKVIAITGAGGVLMSGFAKALAECGAKVALLDINEEEYYKKFINCLNNDLDINYKLNQKMILKTKNKEFLRMEYYLF